MELRFTSIASRFGVQLPMRIDRGIVLAAGASKRLGSHKALIEVEGETLVELVCSKLQSAGLSVLSLIHI